MTTPTLVNYSFAPDYLTQDPLESVAISVVDGLFMAANNIRQVPVLDLASDGSLTLVMLNGTLRQCIDYIRGDIKAGERIKDLYIGCHGDLRGQIQIECYPGQGERALSSYETIASAANDPATTLVIPDNLLATAANGQVLTRVVLFACIVGRYEPVMRKLKEAFGGKVALISAKHIMSLTTIGEYSKVHAHGTYLCLQYVFTLSRPKPLENREAILRAFADHQGLRLADDSRVPPRLWDLAIADEGQARKQLELTYRLKQVPGSGGTLPRRKSFGFTSYSVAQVPFAKTIRFTDPRPPGKRTSGRIDATLAMPIFKSHLAQLPEFADNHPFPVFRRHDFNSIDQFIGGFEWTFTVAGSQLSCIGTRTEYRVSFPITEPETRSREGLNTAPLLFNFYPNDQPFEARPQFLSYDNPRFFLII